MDLTSCMFWLLAVWTLAMMALGMCMVRHLVSPHFTSLNHGSRGAYLGLLVTGEGILLHHLLMLVTGQNYATFEHFVGRVLGIFPPLLMVCACAGSNRFTRLSLQTTGDGRGGTNRSRSRLTFAERGASCESDRCMEDNDYRITGGRRGLSRSLHKLKKRVRNSKDRWGKRSHLLLPFLLSYLWTLAIAMSGIFCFHPNVYPCLIDGSHLDCAMTSRLPRERSEDRDPRRTMYYDDGSVTEGEQRPTGVTEAPVALNDSAVEVPGQPLSWPQDGNQEIALLPEHAPSDLLVQARQGRQGRQGAVSAPGLEVALTSDPDPALPSVSMTTCMTNRALCFCAEDAGMEIAFYVFFVLPLTLSWFLVTWCLPRRSAVAKETELPDSFVLVQKENAAVNKLQLPGLTPASYSEVFERKDPKLSFEDSDAKVATKGFRRVVEPWASEHICHHHRTEKLCDLQKLFSEARGHCNVSPCTCVAGPEPIRISAGKNSPSDSEEGQLPLARLAEAASTSEPWTGKAAHVGSQKDACLCLACDTLSECLLFVCAVLNVEAVVCPLLWGAFGWMRGGTLHLPPPDVLLLPAYCALCFVYRSAMAVSR